MELANKKCEPCTHGVPPLKGNELAELSKKLDNTWDVVNEHHLQKEYAFPDFKTALEFTNKIGTVAEDEGHHPDIRLSYGKVLLQIWTHKIDGLSESDFILAAKCDALIK